MDRESRLELFEKHTALAKSVAGSHWSNQFIEFDEVHQEALVALWKATDRYDSKKGAFTTFAVCAIRNHLYSVFYKQRYGQIGVNMNFQKAMKMVNAAEKEDKPLSEAIAESGCTAGIASYANFLYYNKDSFRSLDEIFDEDNPTSTMHSFLADTIDVEETAVNNADFEALRKIIHEEFYEYFRERSKSAHNPERYVRLLDLFMEQLYGRDVTACALADEIGMSRESVRHQFVRWRRKLQEVVSNHWLPAEAY